MRKNSFGQGLVIFFVIIGILYVIGSIGEASEPKCIKAGCDNKQASDDATEKMLLWLIKKYMKSIIKNTLIS